MAKRFTDTEKYKKQFIRNLPGPYKIFWDYLYHDCSFAGIWQVDFDVAQIRVGQDMTINPTEALKLFNASEERIVVIDGGKKWFIRTFINFQYGQLVFTNKLHIGVIRELKKEGVSIPLVDTPVKGDQLGAKDKYKDKEKEKEKEREGAKVPFGEFVLLTKEEFEKLVSRFGEVAAKKFIVRLNNYIGSKGVKYKSHYHTILSWAAKDVPVMTEAVKGAGNAKPFQD